MNRADVDLFANGPHEDKSHEIKGPIAWSDRCFKGGVLCDIAALANSGGGILLVGRHNVPGFTTGTLNATEQNSYDVTYVGNDVRNYISTPLQIAVHHIQIGQDNLVGIGVGASLRAPAIMLQAFTCANHNNLHFRAGEIYARTDAGETRLLSMFPEIEELFNRIVDYRVTEELQRFRTLGML